MRGSVCKKLRRLAREATEGKPERDPRFIKTNESPGIGKVWHINDGKGFSNKGTTRGLYRFLKQRLSQVRVPVKAGANAEA